MTGAKIRRAGYGRATNGRLELEACQHGAMLEQQVHAQLCSYAMHPTIGCISSGSITRPTWFMRT